jgi:hypothetical protein
MSPLVSGYNQWVAGHATSPGLPRPMVDFLSGAFGPMSPVVPMPIDVPAGDSGRAGPRRWQYPIGWNLPTGQPGNEGYKLAPFSVLRRAADAYSVVRACINIRRDELAGLEWDIGPTVDAQSATKGDKGAVKDQRERALKIAQWFKRIDSNYYGFQSWFTAALEEQIVIDATSLYLAPTRVANKGLFGSDLSELQLLDGASIRPLLNLSGATPRPPSPAYQQYLWGVPRAEMNAVMTGADLDEMADDLREVGIKGNIDPEQEYRADQLLYIPRIRRAHSPYGFGPVEQALIPITLGMSRQSYLLDFYQEGTIPGVFVVAGDQYVTPAQQRQLQDTLNAIAGDAAWKHRVIVLPPGSKADPQKNMDGQWQADQMVSEQVAMILHIQPHEIGLTPGGKSSGLGGKGAADAQAASVSAARTQPDRNWWKETCFDWIIQRVFKQGDLEWKWLGFEEEEDDAKKASAEQQFISMGKASIDELRIEAGQDPWNFPLTQSPFIIAGAQIIPLDPKVTPPAPPVPPAPPGGMPGMPGAVPAHPADAALSTALQPEPGMRPKNDPGKAVLSDKKGDRKKGRAELADRFANNLKDLTKNPPAAPVKGKPATEHAPGAGTAPAPVTATQPGKRPPTGTRTPNFAVPVVVVDPKKDKKTKKTKAAEPEYVPLTVADLVKGKVKYKGDLTKIVYQYLLRSYPAKAVEWAQGKGADWEYEPHVKLADINMARRPGGRDPEKVDAISDTLDAGASMNPVVLVDAGNPNGLEIADGWHRCLGAEKAGLEDLPAFIGSGFAEGEGLDAPWGNAMQDASASKDKAAVAEIATLRRYLRKGGDVTKFVTSAIDPEVLLLLASDITKLGREAALDIARDRVSGKAATPVLDFDMSGNQGEGRHCKRCDGPLTRFEKGSLCTNCKVADLAGGEEKSISLDAPLETGVVPFDLAGASAKCSCGLTLDADGLCPTHGAAAPSKHQQADDMLKAVEAELLKRGINPLDGIEAKPTEAP